MRLLGESEKFKGEVERANRRMEEALAREVERTVNMEMSEQREEERGTSSQAPREEAIEGEERRQVRRCTVAGIHQKVQRT